MRRFLLTAAFASFALLSSTAHSALPTNLQLGRVAFDDAGHGFEVAVPLGVPLERASLQTDDSRLRLEVVEGDEAWLVLTPREEGAVSGLLRVETEEGVSHSSVAGQVVHRKADGAWPTLLVQGRVADGRRALRSLPARGGAPSIRGASLREGIASITEPNREGWQILEARARPGRGETGGRLELAGDGGSIPLQVSAAEAITVRGQLLLDPSVQWERVLPLRERLGSGRLQARLALRGSTVEGRVLRVRQARFDGQQLRLEPLSTTGLRAARSARTLGLRLAPLDPRTGLRKQALLHLSGARARLLDPRQGVIAAESAGELRFARTATVSTLDRRSVFAVRRARGGDLYLTRWQVRGRAGERTLRPRVYEPSLQKRMGVRALRTFSLQGVRLPAEVRQGQTVRERLFLLAGEPTETKARTRPRILSLRLDGAEPRLRGVRTRWISESSYPLEGPAPCLLPVSSPVRGSEGFPVGARVALPAVQQARMLRLSAPGAQFEPRFARTLAARGAASSGFGLQFPRYLRAEPKGEALRLRRIADTPNGPLVRARGELPAVQAVDLRSSARRRHAWALIETAEARYLRLLDAGLPAGTNLPPRIDAGPDLRVRADDPAGARVSLRARLRDANGDPLALRWAAPEARFQDPRAARTSAFFPVGTTQVRVRAREGAKAVAYEAQDVLEVRVDGPTATDGAPGLRTKLVGLFPNPANPRVRVAFTLAHGGDATLRVLDARGRKVRTLSVGHRTMGAHEVVWNGEDDGGRPVASGVYFVELSTDDRRDTQRVALVR